MKRKKSMFSNSPHREVFRLTPLPTLLLRMENDDFFIVDANVAYENLIDLKADEVINRNFKEWLEKSTGNGYFLTYDFAIYESLIKVLKTKQSNSIKITLKNSVLQNAPILNEKGEIEFIMQTISPILVNQDEDQLLSLIINHTEEAFIILNKELKITSFNEKFYSLYYAYFGVEVLVGESILAYARPERRPILEKIYSNVLDAKVEQSLIDIQVDNLIKKISVKYNPIIKGVKEVVGVFVTIADVTEVANFELQLKNREQELALIFDNLIEIVFLLSVEENRRFKFSSVNKAFTLASGLPFDAIIGKYVEEVIPEPSLSLVLSKYNQALISKEGVSWEETTIYPSGKKTAIVSVKPIYDYNGNCIELIGSVYDITERVTAEYDKQKALDFIEKIMNSSLDVICTINKEGRFVTVSAAAERIWGYNPAFLVGKLCTDFIHEEDKDLSLKVGQMIMAGLETSNFQNRFITSEGKIVSSIWSARWDENEALMYCTVKDATAIQEAEKQLQQSEQRFKTLVQDGSDMIAILDAQGNYLYVSPTSLSVLGFVAEEFIGRSVASFIHPDDIEGVFSNFDKVGIEKRVSLSPFRVKHKNGTWRWIETVATDLLEEPSIKGIVTNSRDVTDKIAVQKEIVVSNERYRLVTRATSDAIWDWDLITNELYWGEGFQMLFGYKSGKLIANIGEWAKKIHPNDLEKTLKSIHAVIDGTENNWMEEYLYLKADGNYTYVLDKGFVIRDEFGTAMRMVGAMQDISKRKNEEQQLKLLESVITHTTDLVLITEAEPIEGLGPRIIYVNDAFTKLTGYSAAEVIGKTPRILQGPNTDKAVLNLLKESLKSWQPCEFTLINYKKNGDEFWNNLSITPVADEKGWFTHWISIERDVTAQKNQEIQKILLSDISQLFNTPSSLSETLLTVLETISAIGNYCAAEVWLVDEDRQELNLLTKYSVDEKMEQFYADTQHQHSFKYGEGLPGTVWETQALQVWDVENADFSRFRAKAAQRAKITKGIGLPLFSNEKINGVLILGARESQRLGGLAVLSSNFGEHLGAEIKRKQIEQELNQLFNFAPDIIATINFEGCFKKINPAACNLLEYKTDEFLNQSITKFIHPDDLENIVHQLELCQNHPGTYYFENRYLTKSGRIKWLAWASNTLVKDQLIFSVAKDITNQKNLTDLLLKSNSMGKVGSWEIDVIGGTVYWSDITHEIRETEPGFVPTLETGIHYFKEGRDKETITQKVYECQKYGTPWDEELQIITFKGNQKWIRTIGQAEMVNGKCIRIYGSFQDIDERKKSELKVAQAIADLEESERRYSDLFQLSPLPKWVYDAETLRFLDVNQTAIKHYGYSYEEFMNMTLKDIRPVDEIPNLEEAIKNSSQSGELFSEGIFVHQNKKGERLHVEVKSNTITYKGKMAKVIVANDITERLSYYNALTQKNQKLQEISWIQSHIIRAPLSRMMGLIYLLKNKTTQAELSEKSIIDYIEQSAEELDKKIKEIVEKTDQKEI